MNISCAHQAASFRDTFQNIDKMGKLLKNISAQAVTMENKMMKASIVAQVTGLGNNVDISA